MNDLDDDIARLIARRRNIETLGHSYYETCHSQAIGNPRKTRKPAHNRASRSGGYQFKPGYLDVELDLLQHTLNFAHAGLDIRQAQTAA